MLDLQSAIYAVLKDLIVLAGTVLAGTLTAYVQKHYTAKQVETAKEIARTAVLFAEQTAKLLGINGEAKFKAALEKAKVLAAKAGIQLTDEQWQGLIEAAVKEFSDVWNNLETQKTAEIAGGK
jgi:ABC-type branched-subunit amino acid transport system ATPase component